MIANENSDLNEPRQSTLERAALRRIAALVSGAPEPRELFAAVADEVGRVVDAPSVAVARYEDDGTVTLCGKFPPDSPRFPIGTRMPLDRNCVHSLVRERAQPVRLDDYTELEGEIGEAARSSGMRSSVAAPIVVAGDVWGVIITSNTERLPDATEARLSGFTELLAAAIADTQARETLTRFADEQAALRRVASLVAAGVQPHELFAAVAEEVGRVVDAPYVAVARYDSEDTATVCGTFPLEGAPFRTGSRVSLEGDSVLARMRTHGKPARIDDYTQLAGEVAEVAQATGIRSGVGVPIVVAGRVWGSIVAWSTERLPEDFVAHLAEFTELLAAAITNSGTYEALEQLADEQAALRRVATLVAQGAAPVEVFAAVSAEVDRVVLSDPASLDIAGVLRFDPGPELVVVGINQSVDLVPLGSRWPADELFAVTHVLRTGRPARVTGEDVEAGRTEGADFLRRFGYLSQAASPIVVDGRLWGAISVTSKTELPPDTAGRLERFTELVATAISNADAREHLRGVADEQAALRRVATLVAQDPPSAKVFETVTAEVGELLDANLTVLGRYDGDGAATAIGSWSSSPEAIPVGTRSSIGGRNVLSMVAETGKPARLDDYDDATGEAAEIARRFGWRSSIAAPITVEGRVWGVMLVATQRERPFPAGDEDRLAQFTDLVATSIANTESRDALARLAQEQAALRRIAILVAQGAQPVEVFTAVAEETAVFFDASTGVMRFAHDPPRIIVAGVSEEAVPIGTQWELEEGMAAAEVYRSGRSARAGSQHRSSEEGGLLAESRRLGIVSHVSTPIVVEGEVWGVISVSAREELPPDTEQRLQKFTELVSTAIANAESKSELAASRRRIVAAADEARRRIERDLHDGIQQRLIALTFRARAMTRRPTAELSTMAAELSDDLKDVTDELREVSHGIHPMILIEAGLGPALRALARRIDIPIEVDVRLDERLPMPVETAAYYVASEALTNVTKHAHANTVQLAASHDNGMLTLAVRDDGVGGVGAGRGSGILGLTDRVEALGGTISVSSPPGAGTTLSVRLPITT